jgi:hypothetical protein
MIAASAREEAEISLALARAAEPIEAAERAERAATVERLERSQETAREAEEQALARIAGSVRDAVEGTVSGWEARGMLTELSAASRFDQGTVDLELMKLRPPPVLLTGKALTVNLAPPAVVNTWPARVPLVVAVFLGLFGVSLARQAAAERRVLDARAAAA